MISANKSVDGFQLLKADKLSKAAVEFAQMCILLAINRFPNSYYEQAKLISAKFNEKYKKITEKYSSTWNCGVIKKGYGFTYYSYRDLIKMEYNGVIYDIWI